MTLPSRLLVIQGKCKSSINLFKRLISTMVETNSEIVFNQMLFDRSLGAMRKGYFVAPVEGYWRFDMQLSLMMLSTEEFGLKYEFVIEVLHNNKVGNESFLSLTFESNIFELFDRLFFYRVKQISKRLIKQLTIFTITPRAPMPSLSKLFHMRLKCRWKQATHSSSKLKKHLRKFSFFFCKRSQTQNKCQTIRSFKSKCKQFIGHMLWLPVARQMANPTIAHGW